MNADAGSDGLRADLVCNTLMIEYQNIHQRVLDQIELYETTNTRILTLIGVLFYFGLTNFSNMSDAYTHVIVNLVHIVVIPFIAIASVAFAAAHLVKVMIWGDFLKTIENKVNVVLRPEARFYGFNRKQVLSWEYWRVAYGYAGRSNFSSAVTFSGFLVVAFILASIASVLFRLHFISSECAGSLPLYRGLALGMLGLFLLVAGGSFFIFYKQWDKSMKGVYNDDAI